MTYCQKVEQLKPIWASHC